MRDVSWMGNMGSSQLVAQGEAEGHSGQITQPPDQLA